MGNIYRQGQTGDVIKQAQQALADRGLISQKDVTGTYDKTTAKAIKTFKTNTNGSNTYSNTYGNKTIDVLNNATNKVTKEEYEKALGDAVSSRIGGTGNYLSLTKDALNVVSTNNKTKGTSKTPKKITKG